MVNDVAIPKYTGYLLCTVLNSLKSKGRSMETNAHENPTDRTKQRLSRTFRDGACHDHLGHTSDQSGDGCVSSNIQKKLRVVQVEVHTVVASYSGSPALNGAKGNVAK